MIAPKNYKNETERLKTLFSYQIMDSDYEQEFDDLTHLASQICDTKISLISLVDDKRQWFKAKVGLETGETPKDFSFCGHAIHLENEIFEIPDTREDNRFFDNPLVTGTPHIIFYAGVPLVAENGMPLGTLCVVDKVPKKLTPEQKNALKVLAKQAMNLIELHKKHQELEQLNKALHHKNTEIEKFSYMVAHDLKAPLRNMNTLTNLLLENKEDFNKDLLEIIEMIAYNSSNAKELIDALLEFSQINHLSYKEKENLSLRELLASVHTLTNPEKTCNIELNPVDITFKANKKALLLLFVNLLSNTIKHSDKEMPNVTIAFEEKELFYLFTYKDDNPEIEGENQSNVFDYFSFIEEYDYSGETGVTLGLVNVKKIIEKLGGKITLNSKKENGNYFTFYIKK